MLNIQLIVDFLILALIGLMFYFGKNFYTTYSQEKGKNYATKEDVEEITKKIETVKYEVQHIHSQKSKWNEENKLALTNFFNEYLQLVEFSIKNISVAQNYAMKPELYREIIDKLISQNFKAEQAYFILCLFELEDSIFVDQIKTIFLNVNDLYKLTLNFLMNMEKLAIKLEIEVSHNTNVSQTVKERINIQDEFVKERDRKQEIVMRGTNLLMNIIRIKLMEKYK